MNKIESGCLARVVGTLCGSNGLIVEVGEFIGEVAGFPYSDIWQIDKSVVTGLGLVVSHMSESHLQRIDGNDRNKVVEWAEYEFIPKHLEVKI